MKAIAYRDENGNNFEGDIPFIQIPSGGETGIEQKLEELKDAGMKDITLFDCPPYPDEMIRVTWETVEANKL